MRFEAARPWIRIEGWLALLCSRGALKTTFDEGFRVQRREEIGMGRRVSDLLGQSGPPPSK
jgi:hypothetical protein